MTIFTTFRKSLQKWLLPLAFWLGVWSLAAACIGQSILLPSPLAVGRKMLQLAAGPQFWQITAASLGRIVLGLAAGGVLGVGLAGLTRSFRWADLLISPALRIIRATPVVSFILLVLLWTRRDLVPAVIAAMMVTPVVWGGVSQGLGEVDPKLLEMAKLCRFSRWKTILLVHIPSVWPYLLSALTTGMGLAWKSGVAAEVLCTPKRAIGTQMQYARSAIDNPALFAWTILVVALSLALEGLLYALLRRGGRYAGS
jgi:NitT/TauT family transport system permease protein